MTQTPEKVIRIHNARKAVAELDESENYLLITTKDNGETLGYGWKFKEVASERACIA